MINVSQKFKDHIKEDNKDYRVSVVITLTDGTVLSLTNEDLSMGGFDIDDAISSDSSFAVLGAANANQATIVINNEDEKYSDYIFTHATFTLSLSVELDNNGTPYIETIPKGTYIVDSAPQYNNATITLIGLDYMVKFDHPYSESGVGYPATLDFIVRDACNKCGVTLGTLNFPNKNVRVEDKPSAEALTFRDVLSYAAQIAGCYARMSVDNKLELKWYDTNKLNDLSDVLIDNYSNYIVTDESDQIAISKSAADIEALGVHLIESIYAQSIDVDDVVITGVKVSVKVEDEDASSGLITYSSGTEGYVIDLGDDNPLITTATAQTIVDRLGIQLIGLRFRPLSISHFNTPIMEAGDIAVVRDRKSRDYATLITRTTFGVGKQQQTVCAAESAIKGSSTQYSSQTRAFVELRKLVRQEKTTREQAIEDLREAVESKGGMYETNVIEQGGGTTYNLHNKPNLSESDVILRITDRAVALTSDGGTTWYGMTVDGTMITNILSTTGIDFDWGTGGTLKLGGQNNKNGLLEIFNSSDQRVGRWDNTGLYIGNIVDALTNPNTKIGLNGAITTNSLTAKDYINVEGRASSKIKFTGTQSTKTGTLSSLNLSFADARNTSVLDEFGLNTRDTDTYKQSIIHADTIRLIENYNNWTHTYFNVDTTSMSARSGDQQSFMFTVESGGTRRFTFCNSSYRVAEMTVYGNLAVTGTKPRLVKTDDYGERYLYCYETPSPLFGDVGEGVINDDGKCYVQIDRIFAETVTLNQYQVFLQKYGDGDCYITERNSSYFIVEGTPNLAFGWEIKAKQSDFDQYRLEKQFDDGEARPKEYDYVVKLQAHIHNIKKEREVA